MSTVCLALPVFAQQVPVTIDLQDFSVALTQTFHRPFEITAGGFVVPNYVLRIFDAQRGRLLRTFKSELEFKEEENLLTDPHECDHQVTPFSVFPPTKPKTRISCYKLEPTQVDRQEGTRISSNEVSQIVMPNEKEIRQFVWRGRVFQVSNDFLSFEADPKTHAKKLYQTLPDGWAVIDSRDVQEAPPAVMKQLKLGRISLEQRDCVIQQMGQIGNIFSLPIMSAFSEELVRAARNNEVLHPFSLDETKIHIHLQPVGQFNPDDENSQESLNADRVKTEIGYHPNELKSPRFNFNTNELTLEARLIQFTGCKVTTDRDVLSAQSRLREYRDGLQILEDRAAASALHETIMSDTLKNMKGITPPSAEPPPPVETPTPAAPSTSKEALHRRSTSQSKKRHRPGT